MAEEIKRMDPAEFRELGFLQEVNRQFLHPLGLALEVVVEEDGSVAMGGIWDFRDDPEGIVLARPPKVDAAAHVAIERERHREARERLMGSVVQLLDWWLNQGTGT